MSDNINTSHLFNNLSGPIVGVGEYKKARNKFTGSFGHFYVQGCEYDSLDVVKLEGNNTSSKDFTKRRGTLDESENHYKVKQRGNFIDVYFRSVGIYLLIFNLSVNGFLYTHTIDLKVVGSNSNKLGIKTKPKQKAKTCKNSKRNSSSKPISAKRTQRGEQETPELMRESNEVFENTDITLAKNANPVSSKPNPISEQVQLHENFTGPYGVPTKSVAEPATVSIDIVGEFFNNNSNDFTNPSSLKHLQYKKSVDSNENLEAYHSENWHISREQVALDDGKWIDLL